jgi:hypothetical protein
MIRTAKIFLLFAAFFLAASICMVICFEFLDIFYLKFYLLNRPFKFRTVDIFSVFLIIHGIFIIIVNVLLDMEKNSGKFVSKDILDDDMVNDLEDE